MKVMNWSKQSYDPNQHITYIASGLGEGRRRHELLLLSEFNGTPGTVWWCNGGLFTGQGRMASSGTGVDELIRRQ